MILDALLSDPAWWGIGGVLVVLMALILGWAVPRTPKAPPPPPPPDLSASRRRAADQVEQLEAADRRAAKATSNANNPDPDPHAVLPSTLADRFRDRRMRRPEEED